MVTWGSYSPSMHTKHRSNNAAYGLRSPRVVTRYTQTRNTGNRSSPIAGMPSTPGKQTTSSCSNAQGHRLRKSSKCSSAKPNNAAKTFSAPTDGRSDHAQTSMSSQWRGSNSLALECARRTACAEEVPAPRRASNIDELSASPWVGLHRRHEILFHHRHELLGHLPQDCRSILDEWGQLILIPAPAFEARVRLPTGCYGGVSPLPRAETLIRSPTQNARLEYSSRAFL